MKKNIGAWALSAALMNENNKVTRINLSINNIGPQGLTSLLKSWRFSLVSHLKIANQKDLNQKVRGLLEEFSIAFSKYIPHLVCLASVRSIPRIGLQSPHFRELSSDILIRIAQTLGWFIDLKGTVRILGEHVESDNEED